MKALRSASPGRRGVTLVLVIVCLAVMTIVLGSLLQMNLAGRRRARAEERRLTASWLAEGGLELAWARLSESPDYRGETWAISAETLRGGLPAEVVIAVEPAADAPGRLLVRSRAVFPSTGTLRATQSREVVISPPKPVTDPDRGETR